MPNTPAKEAVLRLNQEMIVRWGGQTLGFDALATDASHCGLEPIQRSDEMFRMLNEIGRSESRLASLCSLPRGWHGFRSRGDRK